MIRVGVIGTGFIGRVHCKNIASLEQAELAAVYDLQSEQAHAIAKEYGAAQMATPEELIQNTSIDALVIASSSDTHRQFLEMAVEAGKPVYCEKPLTLDRNERVGLEKVVRGFEERIFVGFSRRFDAHYQLMKTQSKEIGALEMLHIINRGPAVPPLDYIARSGGQFHDQCIHFFDLLRWLSGGEVQSLYAQGAALADPRIEKYGDIDTSLIHLHLEGGGFASIDSARRTTYGYDERIELHGSKGMLRSPALLENQVEFFNQQGIKGARMPSSWFTRMQDSFHTAMKRFITAVHDGSPCSPNCIDGFIAQRLAEQALVSLQEKRVVRMEAL